MTFLTKNGQKVHEHAFKSGVDSLFACITAKTGEISVCFGSEISGKAFKFPPIWLKSIEPTRQVDSAAAGLCVQHTNGYIPSSYSALSEFICVQTSDIFLEILSKSSSIESLTALTGKVVDPSDPSKQTDLFDEIADAVSRTCSSNAPTRTKIASWCARLAEIENLPAQVHRLVLTLCGLQFHQKHVANTLPNQSTTVFEITTLPSISDSQPTGGVAFGGAGAASVASAGDSKWKCVIADPSTSGVAYRNSPVFDDKDQLNFVPKNDIVSVVERVGPDDNWLKINHSKHGTKYLPIKTSSGEVFFQPLNRAGVVMKFSGQTGRFYCGRRLGVALIPGSDGQCGPKNGPQCSDCKALSLGKSAQSSSAGAISSSAATAAFGSAAFSPLSASSSASSSGLPAASPSGLFGTSFGTSFAFPAFNSSSFLGSASNSFAAGTSAPVSFSSSSAVAFPFSSGSSTTRQPTSSAQSLFPLFLYEIFKQGFAVAETSFESWSLFCRKVQNMLCPAGYVLSSSFFEMFHRIQSNSIHSAFFELSQSQCESISYSLATPLSSFFHFISNDQSGSGRLLNNDVFSRALFLLEEFGNYHQLLARHCMHFITFRVWYCSEAVLSGKSPDAQLPLAGAAAISPSVVGGVKASSLPVVTSDSAICSIGRI